MLESIFKTNFNEYDDKKLRSSSKEHFKEEEYSPGFRNLVGRQNYRADGSPMKQNIVYSSAKNIVNMPFLRQGSILKPNNSEVNNSMQSSYQDYGYTASPKEGMSRSVSYDKQPITIYRNLKQIKTRKYDAHEDRTKWLKYKIQKKRLLMKHVSTFIKYYI